MRRWAVVLAALVFLVALRARGEDPNVDPKEAVRQLMKALHGNKGAVRIGMGVSAADKATPGAANHIDQRFLPLRGSWLDKEGRLEGTVDWGVDLEAGKKVEYVKAVLVVAPFDKKEMGKAIAAAGRELGLKLSPDEDTPDTWFDENAEGIELWITIGDGIVVVDAQVLPD